MVQKYYAGKVLAGPEEEMHFMIIYCYLGNLSLELDQRLSIGQNRTVPFGQCGRVLGKGSRSSLQLGSPAGDDVIHYLPLDLTRRCQTGHRLGTCT